MIVSWEVEYTDEFNEWWEGLTEIQQTKLRASVLLLRDLGAILEFPHSSKVKGSAYSEMRELRVQCQGRPFRVLYAFNPQRAAILLIGGDKTGKDRWYEINVPIADRIFREHLSELRKESEHGPKIQ
jgi:hypothetical protein